MSKYIMTALKGCAMGMADVVPGVSGGTIAFISGIYEELIESIKSINMTALKLLFKGRFREFFESINGKFLFSLLLGIGIAIISMARVMTYMLNNHPIITWSFFFGLIIASAFMVAREVNRWHLPQIISLIVGIVVSYWITVVAPASTPNEWWFIILSGAIAICAMILPGISGAFVLLLMGKYMYIMTAVTELKIGILLLFAIGAVAGLISFSHVLSWLLKHYHNVTVSLLTGFMVGSLNKVWPWKEPVVTYLDSHGELQPLVERNITPGRFEFLFDRPSMLVEAVLLCVVGFLTIYGIELLARILVKKRGE